MCMYSPTKMWISDIAILIIEEDLIRQQAENLEKVEKMLNVLNSEHIKGEYLYIVTQNFYLLYML